MSANILFLDLESIRHRIEHEDNLISQRISWLVNSQAFLVTAYAISLNGSLEAKPKGYLDASQFLLRSIPITGIACILLLWLTIVGAILAMADLRTLASKKEGFDPDLIQGRPLTRILGLSVPVFVPAVFLVIWVVLLWKFH